MCSSWQEINVFFIPSELCRVLNIWCLSIWMTWKFCLAWNPYQTLSPLCDCLLYCHFRLSIIWPNASVLSKTQKIFKKWCRRGSQCLLLSFFFLHYTSQNRMSCLILYSELQLISTPVILFSRVSVRLWHRLQAICSFSSKVDMKPNIKLWKKIRIFGGTV